MSGACLFSTSTLGALGNALGISGMALIATEYMVELLGSIGTLLRRSIARRYRLDLAQPLAVLDGFYHLT